MSVRWSSRAPCHIASTPRSHMPQVQPPSARARARAHFILYFLHGRPVMSHSSVIACVIGTSKQHTSRRDQNLTRNAPLRRWALKLRWRDARGPLPRHSAALGLPALLVAATSCRSRFGALLHIDTTSPAAPHCQLAAHRRQAAHVGLRHSIAGRIIRYDRYDTMAGRERENRVGGSN